MKVKTTIYLITASAITYQAANNLIPADSSSVHSKIIVGYDAVVRSSRAFCTIAVTAADYKYSLYGLSAGSDDYRKKLSEVHLRSAERVRKLCETNKGFYVKAGQFVAAMRQIPKEYSSTLSSLHDQATPCDFKAIKEVLVSNLGHDLSQVFLSLDEHPIAAASIAQVYRAVLKNNQEVAVKVRYPGLEHKMRVDTAVMSFLSNSISWFFPEYRFQWLVSEFSAAISLELDFIQEAKNAERTSESFKTNNFLKVPRIYWDLTTSQVLTMEFCRGHKINDVEYMKEMKINPTKVAKALVEVFAEMIFVHGFLHGDPHPGNILISPEGQNGFTLVLLDHGIYRQLDERFRLDYCQLWKALIFKDSDEIQKIGERFGAGKYARYFPIIFTGRTIDSKSALGKDMSIEERTKLRGEMRSLKLEEISSFMESLPPDFLSILRTDGLLRSLTMTLGASQRVRLLAYAKYALNGISSKRNPSSDFGSEVTLSRFQTDLSYLRLRLVLEVLELLPWMAKFNQFLQSVYETIGNAFMGLATISFK
ncbi:uncharacterized protein [Rutidosis leptorrhynchoides]|uniref:uncharacterized protein n=1 Tax=Rutidosis leptorrhynchoides TaxID=125765 RepID=UPI003A99E091